jgi:glycosyltransferase involved in cell wall biosynthesis
VKTLVLTTAFSRAAPVMGAFLFARYLHQQGEPVVFAALDSAPDGYLTDVRAAGVPTHTFALGGWRGMRHRSAVQRYVDAYAIDVVMSDGLRPDVVNAGLRGVTHVSNVRGLLKDHYALDYPFGVAQAAAWIQLRALRRLDGVFVISPAIADHLAGLGVARNRLHDVDNFIDVQQVRDAGAASPQDLGPGLHIGLFGGLIRRKRIDLAIRGFAALGSGSNARLHLAGEGPLRPKLQALARKLGVADRVTFHGFLDSPLGLMAAMDIVLLTSDREGVPRSLMEAMALGRTCVTSNFPGVSSLIADGETGFLFKPGQVDQLTRRLQDVVDGASIAEDALVASMRERHDVAVVAPTLWRQIQRIAASE